MNNEKANIGKLFDSIAGIYDKFNHVTSMGIDIWWRHQAVGKMKPVNSQLDVAIGTADFAITSVKKKKAKHVTGLDLSKEMMAIGAQKVKREGLEGRIEFIEGSAFNMPFADGQFDAVTCGYGIRNFSNLDLGLSEMYRVLKPGGQLVILEFSYPSNPVVRCFYNMYFSYVMPLIGKLFSHDAGAFKYFMNSVKTFIWGEEMLTHLRDVGFTATNFKTQTFGISTLYTAIKK